MFDIGWSEMAVIAVVALIVIGPKDLPRLLHTAGKLAAKARATLHEFQQSLADMAREAELEELRNKIEAARDFSPERELNKALDPTGEIRDALDVTASDPLKALGAPEGAAPREPGPAGAVQAAPAASAGSDATPPPTAPDGPGAAAPDQNRSAS